MTKKITIAVAVTLVAFTAGFFIGMSVYKFDIEKFGQCLQPNSGEVSATDKNGIEQKLSVVLVSAIGPCINQN